MTHNDTRAHSCLIPVKKVIVFDYAIKKMKRNTCIHTVISTKAEKNKDDLSHTFLSFIAIVVGLSSLTESHLCPNSVDWHGKHLECYKDEDEPVGLIFLFTEKVTIVDI